MTNARGKDFSQLNFHEVVQYYSELRCLMYEELNQDFRLHQCGRISSADAFQADNWRGVDGLKQRYAWRWGDAYVAYNRKNMFKRFDLSIKVGNKVVGLAYGAPTISKSNLKIDIIEATPYKDHKSDVKVFEVITRAAHYYGALLGADEVRLMNPLSESLINYYCSYGYEYVKPMRRRMGVYCAMKVGG